MAFDIVAPSLLIDNGLSSSAFLSMIFNYYYKIFDFYSAAENPKTLPSTKHQLIDEWFIQKKNNEIPISEVKT